MNNSPFYSKSTVLRMTRPGGYSFVADRPPPVGIAILRWLIGDGENPKDMPGFSKELYHLERKGLISKGYKSGGVAYYDITEKGYEALV